jgi:hypothetical protein
MARRKKKEKDEWDDIKYSPTGRMYYDASRGIFVIPEEVEEGKEPQQPIGTVSIDPNEEPELIADTSIWQAYAAYWRAEAEQFKKNGIEGSYYALNYQINELNNIIQSAKVSLRGDDKVFERFWKISTEIQKFHESISWLKATIFGQDPEKKDLIDPVRNIMEELNNVSKSDNRRG